MGVVWRARESGQSRAEFRLRVGLGRWSGVPWLGQASRSQFPRLESSNGKSNINRDHPLADPTSVLTRLLYSSHPPTPDHVPRLDRRLTRKTRIDQTTHPCPLPTPPCCSFDCTDQQIASNMQVFVKVRLTGEIMTL